MVAVYSKDYTDKNDIIDKSFFTGNNYDAKEECQKLAKQLRKDGYKVKTHLSRFDTKDGYFLHAIREKTLW